MKNNVLAGVLLGAALTGGAICLSLSEREACLGGVCKPKTPDTKPAPKPQPKPDPKPKKPL